ncbi:peptidase M4 family protein [Methanosarcina sp. MSH10X1]|nr:peptidase M4 family protein [Methanosarcina sp. MSH10X1]
MAKAGVEDATLTLHQDRSSRKNRASEVPDIGALMGVAAAAGKAARHIYDSQNTMEYRLKLIISEGGPVVEDDAVSNAYDHIGNFRDYFKAKLGRDSIDNNGMDIICNVHFGTKYNNAFFNGKEITLGDGDGAIFSSFARSLDVIAHELGHGVVQWTSNFEYRNQSGALNEHFADVFGTVITQYVEKSAADDADWLIGDEVMGPKLYGEALRCMASPGTAYDNELMGKDPQPDHMRDIYRGPNDNGGVHINSGIMNKAFYLAARELETENAALIWYTALQNLWPTATFNDAVAQIVKATQLLIKRERVRSGSTQKVRAAFKEVGLPAKDETSIPNTPTAKITQF